MWTPLPAGWDEHRPGSAGATVGVRRESGAIHDPVTGCDGMRYKMEADGLLTSNQVARLNRLLKRDGRLSTCQHDLARGASAADLRSGNGPHGDGGNELYRRALPVTPATHGLAGLRLVG